MTVVGAGVIGLSVAHDLAAQDCEVTVVSDLEPNDTVSAVAAALWFPHATEQSAQASDLMGQTLRRFEELADDPSTGVLLRPGLVLERHRGADRSWVTMATDAQEVPVSELPSGAVAGIRATLPVIVTPTYLAWLKATAIQRGVAFRHHHVADVGELSDSADLVVVAAGIRGGELLGDDDSVYPIRGQVVRLANPGLTQWLLDDDNPGGITYVIPRVDDVIVGGTGNVNSWDTDVDPATEAEILARATSLVPELAGQRVLSRAVGLRPARPTIRLEVSSSEPVPTIAAYGHGGAGVTLSWGTAARVVELVNEFRHRA